MLLITDGGIEAINYEKHLSQSSIIWLIPINCTKIAVQRFFFTFRTSECIHKTNLRFFKWPVAPAAAKMTAVMDLVIIVNLHI
jgi:hypothetical protein